MFDDIAIKTENLSKIYKLYNSPVDRLKESLHPFRRKYHHDFYALKDVGFEIKVGESVGIIGKNGSGKSTLLKILAGVLTPTSGSVQVNGKVSALLELGAGFNPELTGVENVFFNGTLMGYSKDEIDNRLDKILGFADIGEFIYQPVKSYSSGMFVRLAFAVSINVDPEILIIDEALAVGDELFQRKCFARIKEFQNIGKTVCFVSHGAPTIIELCNRVLMFDDGELLIAGKPKTVVSLYQKYLYSNIDRQKSLRENLTSIGASDGDAVDNDLFDCSNDNTVHEIEGITHACYIPELLPASTIAYESDGARIYNPAIKSLDGNKVNMLVRGEAYNYCYEVDFIEDAQKVRFGMLIKTLTGLELFGMVSHGQNNSIPSISKGQKYLQSFGFTCALLPGTYFLNAGVLADKNGQEVYLARIIDVAMFKVLEETSLLVSGIVDLSSVGTKKLLCYTGEKD